MAEMGMDEDIKIALNYLNADGKTCLHYAVEIDESGDLVRFLTERGAVMMRHYDDVQNFTAGAPPCPTSPLHLAFQLGREGCIYALLRYLEECELEIIKQFSEGLPLDIFGDCSEERNQYACLVKLARDYINCMSWVDDQGRTPFDLLLRGNRARNVDEEDNGDARPVDESMPSTQVRFDLLGGAFWFMVIHFSRLPDGTSLLPAAVKENAKLFSDIAVWFRDNAPQGRRVEAPSSIMRTMSYLVKKWLEENGVVLSPEQSKAFREASDKAQLGVRFSASGDLEWHGDRPDQVNENWHLGQLPLPEPVEVGDVVGFPAEGREGRQVRRRVDPDIKSLFYNCCRERDVEMANQILGLPSKVLRPHFENMLFIATKWGMKGVFDELVTVLEEGEEQDENGKVISDHLAEVRGADEHNLASYARSILHDDRVEGERRRGVEEICTVLSRVPEA